MLSRLLARDRTEHRTPRVPAGTRVYAVGDVHGCAGLLATMHELIREDSAESAVTRKILIYLGDYVDRGPESRLVLETLASEPLEGFETVALCGNHDAWMLQFLDDVTLGVPWLYNGGGATLLSYGIGASAAASLRERVTQAQSELRAVLPAAHRAFLQGLRSSHREGDYLFVHAGIRPGVPLDRQELEDLLWIREGFLDCDDDHGLVVVHGHTIVDRPEVFPNRIGIDTGAFATGRLTCLVLEGDERRFLQT